MSRVIFLDVDGVINIPRGMDRKLLTHLKGVVEDTGAKIVLSSDWRNAKDTRDEIRRILRLFDMDYVACTPPSKSPFQARRPEEIMAWLRGHNDAVEQGRSVAKGLGKVAACLSLCWK
eukprot:TRINITY_DN14652_c0_g1_i10.p1 TRINITY_DN14652_c0_g1~~TRINITY_DN14652_c0_g1_i10.p1  ORF type:complete len:118 (+),score=24.30 TRINITY_DN14652_c0_g1_i10:81-434(+)